MNKIKDSCMFLVIVAGLFTALKALAIIFKDRRDIDENNPYLHNEKKGILPEDMRQYVSIIEHHERKVRIYESFFKPILDNILSFFGLVLLSPVFAILSLAIYIDDPGPVLFKQKRVGKNKRFFNLHKFRSMKMSTPHDMPTHMLDDPDQYITKVGKVLRRTSLDELPQIWDIFRGKMSVIGPRPALWNQADLVAEREKYGASDMPPGLTGWAQINGRDELEIVDKARFDGEYSDKVSFVFDVKCFIGTIISVLKSEGVVEGGTGGMRKEDRIDE